MNKRNNIFISEGTHIEYEKHTYIIPEFFNNKFKHNSYDNFNLNSEDKILSFFRIYFKYFNSTCEAKKEEDEEGEEDDDYYGGGDDDDNDDDDEDYNK